MKNRKLLTAAAAAAAGALALSACAGPGPVNSSAINEQKVATVSWNQPFYSYNGESSSGNNVTNNNVIYMTNEQAGYYNNELKLTPNPKFATYEKVSDNPLKVKITLADTATWSDGVPVTASDVVLSWAAHSTNFNNHQVQTDDDGNVKSQNTGSQVYFNSADTGFALIKDFPEIGDNNKSVTFTYSKPYVDWEVNAARVTVGLPAHIVAKKALGTADPTAASQALMDAFQKKDNAALSKISNTWNTAFDMVNMPADKDLVVSNGPYTISDLKENQFITLKKNPNYKGDHVPSIDTVTIRFVTEAQANVTALQNGEVLLAQPQSTSDILKQLQGLSNVNVATSQGATYEHVDVVFNNGGPFDPASYGGDAAKALKVRQAFLTSVPRQSIVDNIVKPLNPDATIRNSLAVVPGSPNYNDAVASNGMESTYGGGDTAKAKKLLQEAGVTNPTVRFLYDNTNTRRQQEFTYIRDAAKAAGFTVVDKGSKDWSTMLPNNKQYDASLFGWQSTSTGVAESDATFRTKGQNNYGGYSSAKVDGLLNELQVATDPAKQKTILQDVEKQLVADAFSLPIFQFPEITASSNKLENVSSIALSPTYFWNFWEWKLK